MNRLLRALPLVLLLGLTVWRPTPGEALLGDSPAIRSIVPAEAAPGQLVAIQGTSLFDPAHPEVTEVRFTQAGKVALAQAVAGPSAGDVVYVRVPAGLTGTQQVTIRTLDDNKVSAPMGLRVRTKPGTPVPVRLVDVSQAGFPPLTAVKPGQTVGILAFGTGFVGDYEGVVVDTQSLAGIVDGGQCPIVATSTDPALGVIGHFVARQTLVAGQVALFQVRVRINGVDSDLSYALALMVIE